MRRLLKWMAVGLGGMVVLLVAGITVLALLGGRKLNREYTVTPEPVLVSQDTAVLERGEYLVSVSCVGCHGNDLGGTPFFDDPALGSIPAPNLTAGQGGAAAVYSQVDFVRAIRHGVDPDGKPLMIMPATAFWHFSDADLSAIIAYIQSVPSVDNDPGNKELGLVGQVLVGAGVLDVLAAEHIDHTASRSDAPAQQVDAAYGEYIVNTADCRNCHGTSLTGGQPPEPGAPPAPSLAGDSVLAAWTGEDFLTAMRTGTTPDGRSLNPTFMPWQEYGRLTDEDLTALFLYLQTLPAAIAQE